jgi:acyl-CoA thioester hydrolase
VCPADIDELGHVNNVVYLRWVREVATAHWLMVANDEEKAALGWVVARHEIDYRAPSFVGERLLVETRIGGSSPRRFERLTEVTMIGDGVIVARARTLWCPIDRTTGRPKELGPEIRSRWSVGELSAP